MQPTIEAARKAGVHTVCIALKAEWAVEHLTFIGATVTVGVAQKPDVWDAPCNGSVLVRINAGRNVQPISERCDFVGATIAICVLQHL